ncbi:MAG: 3-oxoacyl-ACP synthase [Legionellales bacterium]|nr:3-oxoacyl-ACP synthase [Legionellales bacterium]
MTYSRIKSHSSYLPKKILYNQDVEKLVDTTDEWIQQRTGIKQRHIAGLDESPLDLAFNASKSIVEDVDAIIVASFSQDHKMPSLACELANRLELYDIPAFDLNAACTGFLFSLITAHQFIANQTFKKILVVGVDKNSSHIDWTDRSTCLLFGDGAGAMILEAFETPGMILSEIGGNNRHVDLLKTDRLSFDQEYIQMSGKSVFKIAVQKGIALLNSVLNQGYQVDWIIMHQANYRIIKSIADAVDIPFDQCIVTVDQHANTSAASIPLAFDEGIRSGKIKRGDHLYFLAFGAGFTFAHTLIKY